jgi:hypothetical protein
VGFDAIGMSQLSTQYVFIPVQATRSGVAYNPTGDPVQMAFMPQATQSPGLSDWVAASWDTNTTSVLYPYSVKCLVGPTGGVISLGLGTYYMYVKVTDSPEIPVLLGGILQITT